MPEIPVKNCCGCTACSQICPVRAIEMISDDEGFLYPTIQKNLCIGCGRCEQVCPVICPPKVPEEYAGAVVARHISDDVLEECTSGGFIDALNHHVLEHKNGFAVGVGYDERFLPTHQIADTCEQVCQFRNSKYAQSDLSDIFRRISVLLEQGNCVVFTGTPCQAAGLKTYLGKEYENLILVDLVCRSVPSPKFWNAYLRWQENRAGSNIAAVACRKKTYGYHSGALEIRFQNGKRYAGSNRVDWFMKTFHHDRCARPSCYDCPFKTKMRCTDFTVFDCWYPDLVAKEPVGDDDRGFSNVLIHTPKGQKLLEEMNNIRWVNAEPEKMFRYTGGMESKSIDLPAERKTFYQDLEMLGFRKTVGKYERVSWFDRGVEALKPVRRFVLKKRRS